MKKLFDLSKNSRRPDGFTMVLNDEYEFCPRCDAKLIMQDGFDMNLPYWVCKGCGQMLVNPKRESDISWFCDECGAYLNDQEGFSEDCGEWVCSECGFSNRIDVSEIYETEAEFQTHKNDPYRGLSDDEVMALSAYSEKGYIGDSENVFMIGDEAGRLYVEKLLYTYEKSIYDHIREHPVDHMPRITELYESANCLIVIEEYIEGSTIAQLLRDGLMEQREAIRIVKEICAILHELHAASIIHRDIKPSNVILTPDGEVYLLDMNVAKWFEPEQKDDTRYLGTQYFAAPEQVGYGMSASTTKSDVYALGVLLNVMLTGDLPKKKQTTGPVWSVIERCISLEAEKRYTADELYDVLDPLSEK